MSPKNEKSLKDLEDAFVKVSFQEEGNDDAVVKGPSSFVEGWLENGERSTCSKIQEHSNFANPLRLPASAKHSSPELTAYVLFIQNLLLRERQRLTTSHLAQRRRTA